MLRHKTFYGGITETDYSSTPWISRTIPDNNTNYWTSIAYGNNVFAAVGIRGEQGATGLMTSPDGITWTLRGPPQLFDTIFYGNGLFVAFGPSSTIPGGKAFYTSSDAISWTKRTDIADTWRRGTWGNGLYVVVSSGASGGTGNRVVTSPDGITWTRRTSAADNDWSGVTWGSGLFVAVAASGTGNRVMTSPDGITWTSRESADDNTWNTVTWGNGLFVAVSTDGLYRVMTSPDGITWTARTLPSFEVLRTVTYGNGIFVTMGSNVYTSPDGITWTYNSTPVSGVEFYASVSATNIFVAVGAFGTGNQVITWNPFSNNLNYDSSTKLVTYTTSNTIVINEGNGLTSSNTAAPVVNFNPASQSLTYNATNPYYINDTFLLSANEFGSTIKATNVLIPNICQINANYAVSNGANSSRLCTSTVWVNKACTVSGVMYYQRTAGSYIAVDYNGFGLYKFSGATGTLLASTATSGTLLSGGANTFKKIPFSISNCTVSRGTYVIAVVYSCGTQTTAPTVGGIDVPATNTGLPSYNLTNGAIFSGFMNTQSSLPNPLMWSNLTQGGANSSTFCPWFSLY